MLDYFGRQVSPVTGLFGTLMLIAASYTYIGEGCKTTQDLLVWQGNDHCMASSKRMPQYKWRTDAYLCSAAFLRHDVVCSKRGQV